MLELDNEKGPSVTGASEKAHPSSTYSADASQGLSQLERALEFAAADIPVFPCGPNKRPLTEHGFKNATTDEATIRAWWKSWPKAEIGIPTGKRTKLAIVDIDIKGGKDGFRSLAERGIELPKTCVNRTPSGGEHHIYERPNVESLPGRIGALSGIDTKADGGYFIAYCPLRAKDLKAITPYPQALEGAFRAAKGSKCPPQPPTSPSPQAAAETPPPEQIERTRYYWEGAIEAELAALRSVGRVEGSGRNAALNKAAFNLGGWIVAGVIKQEWLVGQLLQFAVDHNLAKDDGEPACLKTIRSGIEAGKLHKPRSVFEADALKPIATDFTKLYARGGDGGSGGPDGARHNGSTHHDADGIDIGEPDDIRLHGPDVDAGGASGMKHRDLAEASKGRTPIVVLSGNRTEVVDKSIEVIRKCGDLLQRGDQIVRISEEKIVQVNEAYLDDYLPRHAAYWKISKNPNENASYDNYVPRDIPNKIARDILSKAGEWGLLELKGVIRAPTIRSDGSILNQAGYDAPSGLLLLPGDYPSIPTDPTQDQMHDAWKGLQDPFAEFPFATIFDRGAFYAALFTALTRHRYPLAPAFLFDAPAAASGKTLLALCIQAICGVEASILPQCKDDDEMRKRLLSTLRSGTQFIHLDNLRGELSSPALEAFLTSSTFTDRVLGSSQVVTLSSAVTVLITANNLQIRGDMFRRLLTCRLDAKTEEPERRSFRLKPAEFCREHRQKLVQAALTLFRGYVARGRPRDPYAGAPLGSYEGWDADIRQFIIWLGREGIAIGHGGNVELGDPIRCIQAAKADEPEKQLLGSFLTAVHAKYGSNDWTVKTLISYADPATDLHDALIEIAHDRHAAKGVDARRIGDWLRAHKGTRRGGLFLYRVPNDTKSKISATWRVCEEHVATFDKEGGR